MVTTSIHHLFLLTLTLTTIHARESQFFAKLSNYNPKETQPLNTNPQFIPQSQNVDSFGHETGQLPPSATTTTTPTTTTTTTTTNNNNNNLPSYLPENYNPVAYTTPIHSNTQENNPNEFNYDEPQGTNYNGENTMYNSEKQGMSDTRFLENGKYYYAPDNGYNSEKQGFEDARFVETEGGGNEYNSEKQGFEDARFEEIDGGGNGYNNDGRYNSQKQVMGANNGNMYNLGKQGMSDTRFLENGKYYYDLNMENVNANTNMNSNFNSRNEYNTNSGSEYNVQGYYGNNGNSYDRYNSNGGYQNQEEFQGEQFNP